MRDFFRFGATTTPTGSKERIGAAYYGRCSWYVNSKKLAEYFDATGFPSSHLKNLVLEKALLYFHKDLENRAMKLLVYLLGYAEADGCIIWGYTRDTWPPQVTLKEVSFIARDKSFLEWISSELKELGMKPSVLQNKTVYTLSLYRTDTKAMDSLKEALDAMMEAKVPIAGKLQFLNDLLTHKSLPEQVVAPRQYSFFEYLGEKKDDPIIRALGQ